MLPFRDYRDMAMPLWQIIKAIKAQVVLLVVLLLLNVLVWTDVLPTPQKLTALLSGYFEHQGIWLMAACALLENIAGFNVYFPGSIVLLTGMSLTAGDPGRALVTWFAIAIPSVFSHMVNYGIGARAKASVSHDAVSHGRTEGTRGLTLWMLSTFWHPHFAAVTSLACGSRRVGFRRFFSVLIVAVPLWYAFWGIIMYNFGIVVRSTANLMPLFYCYIVVWAAWDIYRIYGRKRASP